MSVADTKTGDAGGIDGYLTEDERARLLKNLHRSMVWLGVQIPEKINLDKNVREDIEKGCIRERDISPEVHLDRGVVDLHDLMGRLVHLKEPNDKEKEEIRELICILEREKVEDEEVLRAKNLTREQADRLYKETAGVIRALLDLRDLLHGRVGSDIKAETIKRKVEDARRWNEFVEQCIRG
jgi:hypothetical protein